MKRDNAPARKLTLGKSSLRQLSTDNLRQAVGGLIQIGGVEQFEVSRGRGTVRGLP